VVWHLIASASGGKLLSLSHLSANTNFLLSKHMDKHDRPYKCLVPGCEKLQGFTYSGGLLRHEREVHKMHGGTKKSLFCPFQDCKRSSGAGFTRKENLAEHVRRVHRRTSMSADMRGLVVRREGTMERSPLPEERGGGGGGVSGRVSVSTSPYSRTMDFADRDEEVGLKRKRGISDFDAFPAPRGDEEMRSEIKRLRQENEEKDERLRQLEQLWSCISTAFLSPLLSSSLRRYVFPR
jgi:hypothetical protein